MSEALVPIVLTQEQIDQYDRRGADELQNAELFQITNAQEYELSIAFRRHIQHEKNNISQDVLPSKQAAYQAHRRICELEAKWTKNFTDADNLLDTKQRAWIRQQRELEEKLKAQQVAAAKQIEEQNRQETAKIYEQAGEPEKAKEVLQAPIVVPTPSVPRMVPKVAGSSVRQYVRITKVDVVELAKFVVENPLFSHFIEGCEGKLREYIQDSKGKNNVPGVSWEWTDSVAIKK